jgi:hypothetical protein
MCQNSKQNAEWCKEPKLILRIVLIYLRKIGLKALTLYRSLGLRFLPSPPGKKLAYWGEKEHLSVKQLSESSEGLM